MKSDILDIYNIKQKPQKESVNDDRYWCVGQPS